MHLSLSDGANVSEADWAGYRDAKRGVAKEAIMKSAKVYIAILVFMVITASIASCTRQGVVMSMDPVIITATVQPLKAN